VVDNLPPILGKKRYHDLDALRAFAMLLGIALHGFLSFMPNPIWPGQDIDQPHWKVPSEIIQTMEQAGASVPKKYSPYQFALHAIHGFRMPLFFLISGFFTSMMWRQRGLSKLIDHRVRRILLPMIIALALVWPTMIAVGIFGGVKKAAITEINRGKDNPVQIAETIWEASQRGDIETIGGHIEDGADVNGQGKRLGITPLWWASLNGHNEAVEFLIEKGAKVNGRNKSGSTPLHGAAFLGQLQTAELLMASGADKNSKNKRGLTPRDIAESRLGEREKTFLIGFGIEFDEEKVNSGREKVANVFRKEAGAPEEQEEGDADIESVLKKFIYHVYYGKWRELPDFEEEFPALSKESESGIIDLKLAEKKDYFAMVFEGDLEIREAGRYIFKLGSDDGSRLYVNHGELINNDGQHAKKYKEGSIELEPGMARIRVEFFQGMGDKHLSLTMSGPGIDGLALSKDATGKDEGDFFKELIRGLEEKLGVLPGWAKAVSVIVAILYIGSVIPVFHHLWFLYYLAWLVAGFAIIAWLGRVFNLKPWPAWVIASPWRLLWLVPLTLSPQLFMVQGFGPETATGIIPWPPKLLYYSIFFGFGALCFGHDEFEDKVGGWWPWCFLFSIPVLFSGLACLETRNSLVEQGFADHRTAIAYTHIFLSLCAVLYTWLMIFGFIGFFRRFFVVENKRIRYISDSSYWLYLAHLTPMMAIQILISDWNYPHYVKFLLVCVVTTGVLLLMYEYVVRYTIIGTLLNGKRTREPPQA